MDLQGLIVKGDVVSEIDLSTGPGSLARPVPRPTNAILQVTLSFRVGSLGPQKTSWARMVDDVGEGTSTLGSAGTRRADHVRVLDVRP